MSQYIVIQDFTGYWFRAGDVAPNPMFPDPQPKSFKKGDIIEATEQTDMSMNTALVSDGFIIQKDKVQLASSNGHAFVTGTNNPYNKQTIFTQRNIIMGVIVIAVLILIFN